MSKPSKKYYLVWDIVQDTAKGNPLKWGKITSTGDRGELMYTNYPTGWVWEGAANFPKCSFCSLLQGNNPGAVLVHGSAVMRNRGHEFIQHRRCFAARVLWILIRIISHNKFAPCLREKRRQNCLFYISLVTWKKFQNLIYIFPTLPLCLHGSKVDHFKKWVGVDSVALN